MATPALAGAFRKTMIYVEVIPHKCQRYPTCGDWQFLPGGLHVRVSDTGDESTNMLVAMHEIVEAFLCKQAGISQRVVDEYDIRYEKERTPESLEEPGDNVDSPYHLQHKTADLVERLVAMTARVDWVKHEEKVGKLFEVQT